MRLTKIMYKICLNSKVTEFHNIDIFLRPTACVLIWRNKKLYHLFSILKIIQIIMDLEVCIAFNFEFKEILL